MAMENLGLLLAYLVTWIAYLTVCGKAPTA